MSGHRSPLLSWITLFLYLSSLTRQVSGTQRPLPSERKRMEITPSARSYSRVSLLPIKISTAELGSKQQDGPVWVSIAPDNYRAASGKATTVSAASKKAQAESAANKKGTSKRVTRDITDNQKESSKRTASERIGNKNTTSGRVTSENATTERTTGKRISSKPAISKRATDERATGKKAMSMRATNEKVRTSEEEVSKSVPNEKAVSKRATDERAIRERATSTGATSERAASKERTGTMCAYRVLEDGVEGRLCFRHTQVDFTCPSTCRQARSPGGHVVANMLSNGSVLIQWTYDGRGRSNLPINLGVPSEAPGLTVTPTAGGNGETLPTPPKSPSRGQQEQQGGFKMSCRWNGSYTQFECASVLLGSSCTDFLLTELHENVLYRICLQPLWAVWDGAETGKHRIKTTVEVWDRAGCVDFSISPSGMQDIVIAMTTVGGAICVMLVIICLLVAYITENIMSPSVQHTLAHTHSLTARHSTRSHNTHL